MPAISSLFFNPIQRAKTALGVINVEERAGVITVRGISGFQLSKRIRRLWKTSRFTDHAFIKIDADKFSFYSFFLPDILYIIGELLAKPGAERKHTLKNVRTELLKNTWISKHLDSQEKILNYDRLKDFVFDPRDFQTEFFDNYQRLVQQYQLNGFLFAGAPGSGKTYSSLALAYCLEPEKIVVICPNNALFRVWEETILNKIKNPPPFSISKSDRNNNPDTAFIEVYHYESIDKALERIDVYRKKKTVIILDESHNFNELSSNRTNNLIELCRESESQNIIWLSGTPIKAMSREAIPLLRCIDPLFTEDVEERFKKIYRGDAGKAAEILCNRLGLVTFIVPKERLGLQDPIIKNVSVSSERANVYTLEAISVRMAKYIEERIKYWRDRRPGDEKFFYGILERVEKLLTRKELEEYKHYRQALKRIIATADYYSVKDEMMICNKFELKVLNFLKSEEKDLFKQIKSAIKYPLLKIRGECLGNVLGGARKEAFAEVARVIDYEYYTDLTEKKTLIFGSYISSIEAAYVQAEKAQLNPVAVYGKTSAQLPTILAEFEKNPAANPLIATYDSLSTAVPLTMCDVMLMINVPFRDYEMQQAVSRIHRIGADTQVYIYCFYLDTGDKPNITTRSRDILEWSAKEVEKIIGVKSPYTDTEASLGDSQAMESHDPAAYVDSNADVILNVSLESEDYSGLPAYFKW